MVLIAAKVEAELRDAWAPLERSLLGGRAREFMFMGVRHADGQVIHLYKHLDTRRYLNLSIDGRAWEFEMRSGGSYVPILWDDAVARLGA